jgi:hypothetical protein
MLPGPIFPETCTGETRELKTGLAFEAIDDLCNRLQVAGAFLDDVAVCIDNVVLSCCFRDQVLDQAMQLGALRAVLAFD